MRPRMSVVSPQLMKRWGRSVTDMEQNFLGEKRCGNRTVYWRRNWERNPSGELRCPSIPISKGIAMPSRNGSTRDAVVVVKPFVLRSPARTSLRTTIRADGRCSCQRLPRYWPSQRIVHASNETNYCPRCQTGGKLLADHSLSRPLKEKIGPELQVRSMNTSPTESQIAIDPGTAEPTSGRVSRAIVNALVQWIRGRTPAQRVRIAEAIARLAWILRVRRAVVRDNLEHAFASATPQRRRAIARASYTTMANAALDAVTSDLIPEDTLAHAVQSADWKGLDTLAFARAPVLVASAHLGSWELFAEIMARRGVALTAVVRPLRGAFNAWVIANRRAAGMELIAQRGSIPKMVSALRRKRVVVQMLDQAVRSSAAIWVPFFGRPASTTPALSAVALRTGAPVYVAAAIRRGDTLEVLVEGPFPILRTGNRHQAITNHVGLLSDVIAQLIAKYPEQWLWQHRRWKDRVVR